MNIMTGQPFPLRLHAGCKRRDDCAMSTCQFLALMSAGRELPVQLHDDFRQVLVAVLLMGDEDAFDGLMSTAPRIDLRYAIDDMGRFHIVTYPPIHYERL